MIWADRFAIGMFVVLFLLCAWWVAGNPAMHTGPAIFRGLLVPPITVSALFWIVFRIVDFMFDGPLHREVQRHS